jgi:hypothetical protein
MGTGSGSDTNGLGGVAVGNKTNGGGVVRGIDAGKKANGVSDAVGVGAGNTWRSHAGFTYLFPGRHPCHHWKHLHPDERGQDFEKSVLADRH